jgi:hypothetical protein
LDSVDHALFYLRTLLSKSRAFDYEEQSISKIELQSCLPDRVKATPFEAIFHKRNLHIIAERRFADSPEEALGR